jgi:transcriptional regulator GlxA family with amidase domain
LLLDIADVGFESLPKAEEERDPEMAAVYRRIRSRYNKPLSLDQLAREAYLSRRSLTRRFRNAYGVSPRACQIRLRLEAAQLMLQTTQLQIQEIAEEVGFKDIYRFSKAFKRHTGITPSQARRHA